MTTNHAHLGDDAVNIAADMRRANALFAHYSANDRDGVAAIIDEAETIGRLYPLIWCMCASVATLAPSWHTETGTEVLRAFTAAWAGREHEDGPSQ